MTKSAVCQTRLWHGEGGWWGDEPSSAGTSCFPRGNVNGEKKKNEKVEVNGIAVRGGTQRVQMSQGLKFPGIQCEGLPASLPSSCST